MCGFYYHWVNMQISVQQVIEEGSDEEDLFEEVILNIFDFYVCVQESQTVLYMIYIIFSSHLPTYSIINWCLKGVV